MTDSLTKNAQGSIKDQAKRQGKSIQEVIAGVDHVVILDVSASMSNKVHPNKTRYEAAANALEKLQQQFQGRIVLISFNDDPKLCLNGHPGHPRGGTKLVRALKMAHNLDGTGVDFIVISDGQPIDDNEALNFASMFTDPIHTYFIGNKGDRGERFMEELATGKSGGLIDPLKLEGELTKLLTS